MLWRATFPYLSPFHLKFGDVPTGLDWQRYCCQQIIFKYPRTQAQGPRNLYGRDSKFRPTFKSGTDKCLFSVPLLMSCIPKVHQIAQICTCNFKKFPGGNSPGPQKLRSSQTPLLGDRPVAHHSRPPSHFFTITASAAAAQAMLVAGFLHSSNSIKASDRRCSDWVLDKIFKSDHQGWMKQCN